MPKQIIFPCVNQAALIEVDPKVPAANEVVVKTEISTVSPGTERAHITGDANVAGRHAPEVKFPVPVAIILPAWWRAWARA